MHDPTTSRRARRGSYNAMLGMLLPITVGFAALAVDTSWIRLADSQAQDVADAAAHAALIELRRTGNTSSAKAAAEKILEKNVVGGDFADIGEIEFGFWERGSEAFDITVPRPNAVRVEVGRYEEDPVDLTFARIWNRDSATVESSATAATRSLHVVLVMDVTGSFASEIHHAREAAVRFLDILGESHGEDDMMGMTIFTNRFAWAYSEMFYLADETASATARTDWNKLDVASKPHSGCPSGSAINDDPGILISAKYTDWHAGGKKPAMPREYCDEPGTDHHVGMVLGRTLIEEQDDPFAYRAMIVLTDGDPNGLNVSKLKAWNGSNSAREHTGYVEERWREYQGPVPHTRTEIENASVTVAEAAWTDAEIHVWTVSFRAKREFLKDMPQGDGKFYYTENAAELVPIFEDIASSLPLVIVK